MRGNESRKREEDEGSEGGGAINYGIRSAQKKVYVLVSFFARPFVSLVSHIVRYAPFFSDKGASLRKLHST